MSSYDAGWHHMSLGKCKLKQQGDTTSPERPKSETPTTQNAGKDEL